MLESKLDTIISYMGRQGAGTEVLPRLLVPQFRDWNAGGHLKERRVSVSSVADAQTVSFLPQL